ncbi:hypothetical protein AC629_32295 [Bradyrhizobium sp. NAS80.1]|nr:hypothetical protein AC629_32295 [Bradyrhizobium sp. NAS80.1]
MQTMACNWLAEIDAMPALLDRFDLPAIPSLFISGENTASLHPLKPESIALPGDSPQRFPTQTAILNGQGHFANVTAPRRLADVIRTFCSKV